MTVNTDPLCPQQHTHPKHSPNRCIFCEYGAAVRSDALNAAREAVDALTAWPEGIESDDLSFLNYLHGVRDALTAIDTLRKDQG